MRNEMEMVIKCRYEDNKGEFRFRPTLSWLQPIRLRKIADLAKGKLVNSYTKISLSIMHGLIKKIRFFRFSN